MVCKCLGGGNWTAEAHQRSATTSDWGRNALVATAKKNPGSTVKISVGRVSRNGETTQALVPPKPTVKQESVSYRPTPQKTNRIVVVQTKKPISTPARTLGNTRYRIVSNQ